MRRTRRWPLATVIFAAVAGCAGSSAPLLSYAPTGAPLQYEVSDLVEIVVEAPGMTMESAARTSASLTVSVRDTDASVTFDAFAVEVDDQSGGFSHDGGSMLGAPFVGRFVNTGGFEAATGPDIPSDLLAQFDPATWLLPLFPPLPEPDHTEGSWPHRYSVTDRTEMAMTSTFEGEARFAGDTVVNGRPGRIIVSEGIANVEGTGQPAGAPAQLDMVASATVRSVYVWDPVSGTLIGGRLSTEGEGTMSIQGFELGVIMSGTTEVSLKR